MREQGRVRKWFESNGYGFVRTDAGDDVFLHGSQTGFLVPEVGNRVSFERGTNPRTNKPEAKNVSILDGETQ